MEPEIAAGDQGVSHYYNICEQVSLKEGRQVWALPNVASSLTGQVTNPPTKQPLCLWSPQSSFSELLPPAITLVFPLGAIWGLMEWLAVLASVVHEHMVMSQSQAESGRAPVQCVWELQFVPHSFNSGRPSTGPKVSFQIISVHTYYS